MAKNPNKIKETFRDQLFGVVNFAILTILMIVLVYPFYNGVILAFNDGVDAANPGIYFFPRVFTLDNFKAAVSQPGMIQAAFISVARTVIGTASSVIVTSAFAYAISKEYLRFRRFYFIFMIIPMFFGGGMIPTYLLIRGIGLYNNFLVYILPSLFSIFNALIFLGAFRELPVSLEESAMLDGAGHFTLFFRIVLPVSMPVIAAICVFTAIGHWNSWFDTMMYTKKEGLNTMAHQFAQVAQAVQYLADKAKEVSGEQINATRIYVSVQLAAMLIATAPVMVVYPFFQKYFVRGVMIGAIKG